MQVQKVLHCLSVEFRLDGSWKVARFQKIDGVLPAIVIA